MAPPNFKVKLRHCMAWRFRKSARTAVTRWGYGSGCVTSSSSGAWRCMEESMEKCRTSREYMDKLRP